MCALNWMFVSSQNSCIEALTSNVTLLESGAFERWLSHEGGALKNGISTPINGMHRAASALPPCEGTERRCELWTKKKTLTRRIPCRCLDLRLHATTTVRNQFLLFIIHPVCGIFLRHLEQRHQHTDLSQSLQVVPFHWDTTWVDQHLMSTKHTADENSLFYLLVE